MFATVKLTQVNLVRLQITFKLKDKG